MDSNTFPKRSRSADQGVRAPAVVADIDGTVSDCRHRMHYVTSANPDWDAFFAEATNDPPLRRGMELVFEAAPGNRTVWLTGRPERFRVITVAWLAQHGLPVDMLYMRPNHDRRPVAEFKVARILDIAAHFDIRLIVDDDDTVVTALRDRGWPVQQATWMPR